MASSDQVPADPDSFTRLIAMLKSALDAGLPGADLHTAMAPSHRDTVDPEQARKRPHREGAVLVILYPTDDGVSTLYTVRRPDLNDHAGQISFPGGRREDGETLDATALREAEEEIGIDREEAELLGELTPLFIPPSRYIVHPFLAVIRYRPDFRLQESEVVRLIEVPLSELRDPANRRSEIWTIRNERSRVPWFEIAGERIWGATAMITNELLAVVASGRGAAADRSQRGPA